MSTNHISSIVLTKTQLVNTNLLPVFISSINCQLQSFAVILRGLFKLEKIKADSSHIHAGYHCQVQHAQSSGIILNITMNDVQLNEIVLILLVKIELIADIEE